MTKIYVRLADAPTDVLVELVDSGPGTVDDLYRAIAPASSHNARETIRNAAHLLVEMGWASSHSFGGNPTKFAATDDGREAVAKARASSVAASSGGGS
jgi:hypothetical protein